MISTSNITLRVGKKALFEDVNIKFTEGNCYGLIGANGAGKSTFLKILSGQLEPTNGEVIITPGQRLSFLQQDHFKYDEYPVLDTVMLGNARLYEIMKEKEAIYAKEDFTDEDGVRASELEGEFADLNGWEAESDAATLLNGLGIDTDLLYADNNDGLKALYYFINANRAISFDFYDNTLMHTLNTIVVKDRVAIICALDQYNRVNVASVIFDPEKVNQIYVRTLPAFRTSDLLAHATEQLEFYQHGYRTDFYTKDNFQFLLTLGFEYLLPQECWDKIINVAKEDYHDEFMALIVAQLQITWEEIFEKNTLDFYVLKSSLMKYIDDGEIIFADVIYHMTPEERKLHIENVLALSKKNRNIQFYVVDDEQLVNKQQMIQFSIFNNRKKLFLKNPGRYHTDVGPYFYSVLSDQLIQRISSYLDDLKNADYCSHYDAESLQTFYDKYSSLVHRMIDLSAFKK